MRDAFREDECVPSTNSGGGVLSPTPTDRVRRKAEKIGFDLVGFAEAKPAPETAFLRPWLERGYEGEMAYLRRNVDLRENPRKLEPWAKSIVSVAVNYNADQPSSTDPREVGRGWLSRYAWGDDYHESFKAMLHQLADAIRELGGGLTGGESGVETRACVDTAPILDRVCAKQSGLGWFGKNTCIIHRSQGSYLFLGEVLTNLELGPSAPETDHCGTCTACIDACPTSAIREPYVLDSRRCISYLTIELRGSIPLDLRDAMGTHVFGCDICQDVCPWNRKPPRASRSEYGPRPGNVGPELRGLLELSLDDYRTRFRRSPVKRAKYVGLLRNTAVAAGNSGDASLILSLKVAAQVDPLVAEHAEWAMRKLER